jgi:conjugal transfer ATP-binding protein TraC
MPLPFTDTIKSKLPGGKPKSPPQTSQPSDQQPSLTPPPKQKEPDKPSAPAEKLGTGMVSIQDVIAPESIDVDFNNLKIGNSFFRTLFVAGYPRYVSANWLAPLINFEHSLDISMFVYPVEGREVLDELRRKIGEMEAEIETDIKRGHIASVETEIKLEDAKALQQELAKGAERFFQFGLYITITASTLDELNSTTKKVQSLLGSLLIISKASTLQMEEGLKTTLPLGQDHLMITRNMDTTSLATTFPFASSELSANEGIMYGINEHNDSLIIFDRFTLENANMVIFGKSGSGKSFFEKLEILRSLMFGVEVVTIDPEEEYHRMCDALSGTYINFHFNTESKINPFDLSGIYEEGENELGLKILSLHGLLKVMLGDVSPNEEAILDRALIATYKARGITPDPATQKNEPPLMEDLYKTLIGMEEEIAKGLASRLEKYVKGSLRTFFDQQSNVDFKNPFTVFSLKEVEDETRPIIMYMILDYIWTRIKRNLKKRLVVVDEAWYLMKNEDSATFLYSIAKRARKYFLGLTTITQDVEDFLNTDYGHAIVTNSSIQILFKQSSAGIERLAEAFYLSEGEKHLLLAADVGEGLFFAGQNHVAMRVVASSEEHNLITTKPEELLDIEKQEKEESEPSISPSQEIPEPTPPAKTPPSA